MNTFLIKKSFCDDWDNLLSVFVTNVIYLLVLFGSILGILKFIEVFLGIKVSTDKSFMDRIIESDFFSDEIAFGNSNPNFVLMLVVIAIIVVIVFYILNVIKFAWGELACKYADFDSANVLDFFKVIPSVLVDALLYTLLVIFITVLSVFSIWFYCFASNSKLGFFVGAFLFWIDIFIILSLQWFVPLRSMFHNNFGKCLKKCFLIFFDNTGFSIFMFIHNLILTALSIFPFAGFFPSIAGIGIAKANALRLRMYKYDYLEEHPELQTKRQRRKIPWDELIYDDIETLGPRTFKSFIFPWKEGK